MDKIKLLLCVLVLISIIIACGNSANIEYANFVEAQKSLKIVSVKGVWQKDKETKYDMVSNTFTFFMKDDKNAEMKVILEGAKPNNFDIAVSIVAKGSVRGDVFYAKEILTKCPAKYEEPKQISKQPIKTISFLSADEIIEDFKSNQIRANNKYQNKIITFKGNIYEITKSPTNYTVIEFDAIKFSTISIKCALVHSQDKKALQLSKGDEIIITGKCTGQLNKNEAIYFLDCSIK